MDDNLLQAYERLTAHEFFLEVMYANWFASIPEANARQLSADLRRRMRTAYAAPDADQSTAETQGLQIMQDAEVLADRLLQKIETREAAIREELSRRPSAGP
jgi:hypothetical protein